MEKSPHNFWLSTCGHDTYRRGTNNARNDTPWNAFTADGSTLVCTLWIDQVVSVHDAQSNTTRRFVKIGGKLRSWKSTSVSHGKEASRNLSTARADKRRVIGYEIEPNEVALRADKRVMKFVYMERAHELRPVFGISGETLKDRLPIEQGFKDKRFGNAADVLDGGYLFELVPVTGYLPGSLDVERPANEEGSDDDSLFDADEDDESTETYARKSIQILVAHVMKQSDGVLTTLTYKELAELLGRRNKNDDAWARRLGHVLGRATDLIDNLTTEWRSPVPYLSTVVVDARGPNKGLPGVGVQGKWPGYETLTRSEKESKVLAEYQRILEFGSRWNDVLSLLNLPRVEPPIEAGPGGQGSWGGGESEAHKALKVFVRDHPELVGAELSWKAVNEYALRSSDEIDVFFQADHEWIGVEVKSSVSDGLERDYERGIYQVVKYRALLKAQALADHPINPPSVKVVLLLQSKLPQKYRSVAELLDVHVLEQVNPVIAKPSERPT